MKLYNTMSRKTEIFSPTSNSVKMYVCGITPYAPAHVGHAMRSVVFDVLRRYLEHQGFKVTHVENFTDIDDKMIQSADEQSISTHELAKKNIELYLKNMDILNVLRADIYPKATEEIPEIRKIIEGLVQKGSAYAINGNVYFRVRNSRNYGKLSHRTLDHMRAGARVEVDVNKEDPMDFALWKSNKPGEPSWESPWGPGRPGWHIECSAMATRYLDTTVDIHGGGQDLIFPHHENEIAQSESYDNNKPMAHFWVHNGLLRLGNDKMSKSQGNFISLDKALRQYSSDALRLFFLSSHYRSPLTYSDEAIIAQERAANRLSNAVGGLGENTISQPSPNTTPYTKQFLDAMEDDLNTPRAVATLFDLAHDINRQRQDGNCVAQAQKTLSELASTLGLTLQPRQNKQVGDIDPLIKILIDTRSDLRDSKQYTLADQIRKKLADTGYELEDTPNGTQWRRT